MPSLPYPGQALAQGPHTIGLLRFKDLKEQRSGTLRPSFKATLDAKAYIRSLTGVGNPEGNVQRSRVFSGA